jgi:hypothetical protein
MASSPCLIFSFSSSEISYSDLPLMDIFFMFSLNILSLAFLSAGERISSGISFSFCLISSSVLKLWISSSSFRIRRGIVPAFISAFLSGIMFFLFS